MNSLSVLIVDDDELIRKQLKKELNRNFFITVDAADYQTALQIMAKQKINIVMLDVKLPDKNGLDLLKEIKGKWPHCQVIIITGFGNQEIAIQAIRGGAIDYIEKPVRIDDLAASIGRAKEKIIHREKLVVKNAILIIDDDIEFLQGLQKVLKKTGYLVFSAYDGFSGLNILENNNIDVIVTNVKLAEIDGIEVIKRAKNLFNDIECIVITGFNEQELAVKALRAGALDYLLKPINLEELLFSIKKAIERINLKRNYLYRNRELKISSEIISKMNKELEKRIQKKAKDLSHIQTQLFQTSKLATLGEMAAGLAHEMNQPLGGISLVVKHFRKLIQIDKLNQSELNNGLTDIEASINRMSKIIQHIRTFARQDTLSFVRVDINSTIESALGLLGEQLRLHEIIVKKHFNKQLPQIIGEPYQLEQVWINLLTNARDALDEKKKTSKKQQKKIIIESSYKQKNNSVEICFRDNGTGMESDIAEKVFEPFFTTKEVGKATGLGLSISYGIIESHNGKIILESEETQGTTVRVILPAGGNYEQDPGS